MGLSDEHEGIIDLPADAPVGAPFADWLGLKRPGDRESPSRRTGRMRWASTASRGDLAAAGNGPAQAVRRGARAGRVRQPAGPGGATCRPGWAAPAPFVVGRFFRGVTNRPEPGLGAAASAGDRAAADLCAGRYHEPGDPRSGAGPCMFSTPAKLAGDLTMRMARDGETTPGARRQRIHADLRHGRVIADDRAVHAIGGLMGGAETGCQPGTTNVFLEVALFDTLRTAATGRKLGFEFRRPLPFRTRGSIRNRPCGAPRSRRA